MQAVFDTRRKTDQTITATKPADLRAEKQAIQRELAMLEQGSYQSSVAYAN